MVTVKTGRLNVVYFATIYHLYFITIKNKVLEERLYNSKLSSLILVAGLYADEVC